jgi:hypothetical protein
MNTSLGLLPMRAPLPVHRVVTVAPSEKGGDDWQRASAAQCHGQYRVQDPSWRELDQLVDSQRGPDELST